jgi:spoIIIJ-associated protein
MEYLEISAKTVEEATRKALEQLDADRDAVDIEIISAGKSGILGLGAEDARIRAMLKNSRQGAEDQNEGSKKILNDLLTRMGVQASIQVEDQDGHVVLNIVGQDLGMLIGRRGQTLDALQYLLRLIATRHSDDRVPIIVDVEGYKQHRYDDLRTLALNIAEQVKIQKSSFRLEPMSSYERRIIHMTLADNPYVTTESTGEGEYRKVVVLPKK